MHYASIDIGTNSCRLLIARIHQGRLELLERDIRTTRIGEGLSSSGKISRVAAQRTLNCLLLYQQKMRQAKVKAYRIVATSAVREALNRHWFEELCRQGLGQPVQVIPAEEEARLTYQGVERGLQLNFPPLVVDLGGGSTELIYRQEGRLLARSLPLGAVRGAELKISNRQVISILEGIEPFKDALSTAVLVFCGGTATSVVAMKYGMSTYDSQRVHGERLDLDEIIHFYQYLLNLPVGEREQVPGLQAERADIIVSGLMIMLNLMQGLQKEWALVSESDLLEGLIWEMALGS